LAVDIAGVYSACFMLLYGVLAVCMLLMHLAIKRERYRSRVLDAQQHNFLEQD